MIRPSRFPVFVTPRLAMRPLVDADAPQLFEIFRHPEVMRYWSTVPMADVTEAAALVTRSREHFETGVGYRWAVTRNDDASVIGTLSLFHLDEQNNRGEVGYALGRPWWGSGYMREALAGLVEFAFGEMDVRRLEADTDPRNANSVKLLEGLGFHREGLLRERWVVNGEISDSYLFGLLRREWQAAKPLS